MELVSDVSPGLAVDDPGNVALGHSVAGCQCRLAFAIGVSPADGKHLSWRKLSVRVVDALGVRRRRPSAFGIHVRHVVLMCPKEEMGRTDARPIVAAVKNMKAVRDRATSQRPCHAVSISAAKPAITGTVFRSRPYPAFIGLRYFGPEAIRHWQDDWRRAAAFPVAVFLSISVLAFLRAFDVLGAPFTSIGTLICALMLFCAIAYSSHWFLSSRTVVRGGIDGANVSAAPLVA